MSHLSRENRQTKEATVDGIPRHAVLKPAHAEYRLQNQQFATGDRVVMVKDSGSVPLATGGVVVGINIKTLDVVWDTLFTSGSTLGNKFVIYLDHLVDTADKFHTLGALNTGGPQLNLASV